jgi:hypothetical protein
VNSQFEADVRKGLSNINFNQELPPGTPRRWEPECGTTRLEERIRKETAYAIDNKKLPFSVQKPPKPRGYSVLISCDNCGYVTYGTNITTGIICPKCKTFSSVTVVKPL